MAADKTARKPHANLRRVDDHGYFIDFAGILNRLRATVALYSDGFSFEELLSPIIYYLRFSLLPLHNLQTAQQFSSHLCYSASETLEVQAFST